MSSTIARPAPIKPASRRLSQMVIPLCHSWYRARRAQFGPTEGKYVQDLSSAVDLLVWSPLENLYHYRFAFEFLSEDPFQLSVSAWPSTRGRILPGGLGTYRSQRAARSDSAGPIDKRDHRVDSTFSLRIYWSKYGTFRVGTWITRAIQKLGHARST